MELFIIVNFVVINQFLHISIVVIVVKKNQCLIIHNNKIYENMF